MLRSPYHRNLNPLQSHHYSSSSASTCSDEDSDHSQPNDLSKHSSHFPAHYAGYHQHHSSQQSPYVATNECRVIEYRGARIAAFLSANKNPGEYLLCLPQAFELFLKHLVGGLHTVYTKLKVRILRGLGAIQPGVNRCKLLSTKDFDVLFKDCTTARPGRPPKRSPVAGMVSPVPTSLTSAAPAQPGVVPYLGFPPAKKPRYADDPDFGSPSPDLKHQANNTNGVSTAATAAAMLAANGYSAAFPFLQHFANSSAVNQQQQQQQIAAAAAAKKQHSADDSDSGSPSPDLKHQANNTNGGTTVATAAAMLAANGYSAAFPFLQHFANSSTTNQQQQQQQQQLAAAAAAKKPRNTDDPDSNSPSPDLEHQASNTNGRTTAATMLAANGYYAAFPFLQRIANSSATSQQQQQLAAAAAALGLPGLPSSRDGCEAEGTGSGPQPEHQCLETLLRNIEGLLAIAAHNARQQQSQLHLQKAELRAELAAQIDREREIRDQIEKQLNEEQKIRLLYQKRFKKERRFRRKLEQELQLSSAAHQREAGHEKRSASPAAADKEPLAAQPLQQGHMSGGCGGGSTGRGSPEAASPNTEPERPCSSEATVD